MPAPDRRGDPPALRVVVDRTKWGVRGLSRMPKLSEANVVVSSEGAPCLVDFALATSLGELRVEFVAQSGIDGTLAYLAQEQTTFATDRTHCRSPQA